MNGKWRNANYPHWDDFFPYEIYSPSPSPSPPFELVEIVSKMNQNVRWEKPNTETMTPIDGKMAMRMVAKMRTSPILPFYKRGRNID